MQTESLIPYLTEFNNESIHKINDSINLFEKYMVSFSNILKMTLKPVQSSKPPLKELSSNQNITIENSNKTMKDVSCLQKSEQSQLISKMVETEKNINLTNLTLPLKVLSVNLKENEATVEVFSCKTFPWLSKVKFLIPECPDSILKKLCQFKIFLFTNITGILKIKKKVILSYFGNISGSR
jgi:hypothetical protein